MLKPPNGCDSLRLNRPTPLKIDEVEDEQIVEPVLAITSTENEHHILDDAGCVELTHWGLTTYDARDVEGEFFDTLLQINEYHV